MNRIGMRWVTLTCVCFSIGSCGLDPESMQKDVANPIEANLEATLPASTSSSKRAYGEKYDSTYVCDAVDSFIHGYVVHNHCAWFNFPGIDDDGYYVTHP